MRTRDSLFWKLFIPVGLLLVLAALAAALVLPLTMKRNAEQEAVTAAQESVRQFVALRKYYTENVVAKAMANGMQVSFDHAGRPDTLPLPATMIHELSAVFRESGTSLQLYSPYPFPNRAGRTMDAFGQDAWNFLRKHPDQVFSRTESIGDRTVVRVAIADRMVTQACVACHNSVVGSPKTDWVLGDVRGVLEVDSSKQLDAGARVVTQILWALAGLLLLLAFALRAIFERRVARPLQLALDSVRALAEGSVEKAQVVETIANGDLDREVADTRVPRIREEDLTADESGELLRSVRHMAAVQLSLDQSFRKMSQALRLSRDSERAVDWLKTGTNELGRLIRGEQALQSLADQVLTFLVERLGAAVAVLYLYDESQGALLRSAGYALPSGCDLAERLDPGEGLMGQALREARTLCLDQFPAGHLLVGAALGQTAPLCLLVIPLQHAGRPVGAIEIGTLKGTFNTFEREFVEQAREAIAIGFAASQSRQRAAKLLADTEQQAEELRVQQEELQQINEELEERAEMLERSREQIAAKNAELETAGREILLKSQELQRSSDFKSNFLANMSHELRTPLNSMLILSSLLKNNADGNLSGKQVEYAETIHGAGNDLLRLINEILDLSKVEAGQVDFVYQTCSVRELCDSLERLFRPLAEHKHLGLTIECDADAPECCTIDGRRAQQILRSLLANALKFTHAGEVGLRVFMPHGADNPLAVPSIGFAVRDTGIGVAPDKRELIFEAFRQSDSGISRKYGGTGLGLSISRQLARKMGGEVLLSRSDEGHGSTFTLFLPLEPDGAERIVPTQALRPAVLPPAPRAPARETEAPLADDRQDLAPGERAILIVEDDLNFATVLLNMVRERGFKALVAVNGEDGLRLAHQYRPSALLLDVMLPGMDGWALMQRLKAEPATRGIAVHFISCLEEQKKAMSLGAIGYATKPVNAEQLLQVFQTVEQSLQQSPDQRDKRLLIVEDDASQGLSLQALLQGLPLSVQVVDKGRAALELLRREAFDCLILDLGLSDMPGEELLRQLQGMDATRGLRVIIHTGRELRREEERALRQHANCIIVKGDKSSARLLDEVRLFLHALKTEAPAKLAAKSEPPLARPSAPAAGAPLNSDGSLAGKKLLLVDDDMRNVFSISSLLMGYGIDVVVAENGREALEALQMHADIGLVLMDIMMPEMDGFETMRRIRQDLQRLDLPIIAMTAKAMKGDQQQCLEAGASDYIAKPVDVERLISLLRVWTSAPA